MQINEVTQPSEQKLTEMVEADNNTGLLTEDVVKIIRAKDDWSAPMTGDEFTARLMEVAEQNGIKL